MALSTPSEALVFGCPIEGRAEPIALCPDPTFSQGILGPGVFIQPEGCVLWAPADAQVEFSLSTKHALGFSTAQGVKFLIHLGLDTNRLEGRGFELFVQAGDLVRRGDKLLAFDPRVMEQARCSLATPFVFCSLPRSWRLELLKTGPVQAGEDLIRLTPLSALC